MLYQGGLLVDRGIEQSMDAILDVPGAVLVLMGFGNQETRFRQMAATPMYAGKVHVLDAVPPNELLWWSASADVMVMLYQPTHREPPARDAPEAVGGDGGGSAGGRLGPAGH